MIGPEDTITIHAADVDEISHVWRVGVSGDLKLPIVGKIRAAGLTIDQLEEKLIERLKPFIRDPEVSVYVSDVRSKPVTVTGAVDKPGLIQLQGEKTLFDVLNAVGGPKDSGPTLTLTRPKEHGAIPLPAAKEDLQGKYNIVELDVRDVMDGRSAAANLPIQSNDVIDVSRVKRMVYILGEVVKPGSVELVSHPSISLTKVYALAGGMTRTAASSKVRIMHMNEQGIQGEIAIVNMKAILEGKAKDLELTSGDVVTVPNSQLSSFLQAASLSAVTSSMVLIGRF